MGKKKKGFGVGVVLLVSIVLALSVLAARLPNNGQDSGSWGTLLNDYLGVIHDSGGSLKGSVVGSSQISDIGIQAIDINQSVVNATHILDATITNADIAFAAVNQSVIALNAINTSQIVDFTITNADIAFAGINQSVIALNAINTSQIVDFTITNADIAFAGINQSVIAPNSVNTTQIVVGGLTGNAIAANAINTTHIAAGGLSGNAIASYAINNSHITPGVVNTTQIFAGGLTGNAIAANAINTTHIAAGGLSGNAIASYAINNSHIAVSSINGSQISNTAALNVTSLAITGVNRTATGVPYPYFNISGIFFNRTIYDLPSTTVGDCPIVNVNMTGIPANSLCIFVGGDDILLPNVQSGATVNLTFTGINSTAGNCRVRVCNGGLTTADPGILTFAAIGIAGNGL